MTSDWERNANKLINDITQPYYIGSFPISPLLNLLKRVLKKKKFQTSN